jgi:hypothetical protein
MTPSRLTATLNDAALSAIVRVQTTAASRAEDLVGGGRIERWATGFGAACGALMATGTRAAYGASAATTAGGCDQSGPAGAIQSFISSAASFAIGIGAGGALLMLALGALLIIFGGTPDRVSKGMKVIKNAVIGLGLLAAGLFLKFIVVTFIFGAVGSKVDASAKSCLGTGGI